MRARQRLKDFLKSERGNVLAMGAAAMPMLLASAGFAVDTIQLSVMKRQMQRAADSSAIAGAYALTQAPAQTSDELTVAKEKQFAESAVTRDIAKNKTPALLGTPAVVTGPIPGYQKSVQVSLTATPRLPFMAIFTKSNTTVTATATAALVDGGRFCMLSLYDRDDLPGIQATGNAELNLGCGMATNARGTPAIDPGGSAEITASPVMAPGGLPYSTRYATGTKLQPYSAEQKDPFAHLNVPSYDGSNCPALDVNKDNSPVTIAGGCYSSITVQNGTLNVSGEIVVAGGNIDFQSKADVQGSNVTFFLTEGTYDAAANATMNLSAPTAGTYKDLLFFRDRSAPQVTIKLNGGTGSTYTGALYFPTVDLDVNGNAGFTTTCFQLVARRLLFSGNMNIKNNCSTAGGGGQFTLQYVRLVK